MSFEGRVAFITGASGGIGAAVARMLHDAGASVGLASRRGDDLGLERGLGVACDVRDPEAVDAAVAATVDRFGGSTSSSRTPASARTARSSSSRASTSTR